MGPLLKPTRSLSSTPILATALLCAIALAAGYMPARRTAACDPVRVLRAD